MWYGYTGKVLRVNLTDSQVEVESLDREAAKAFMGSNGLGTKYLYDEMDPSVDALSPDNVLIFVTGPLTGTFYAKDRQIKSRNLSMQTFSEVRRSESVDCIGPRSILLGKLPDST